MSKLKIEIDEEGLTKIFVDDEQLCFVQNISLKVNAQTQIPLLDVGVLEVDPQWDTIAQPYALAPKIIRSNELLEPFRKFNNEPVLITETTTTEYSSTEYGTDAEPTDK